MNFMNLSVVQSQLGRECFLFFTRFLRKALVEIKGGEPGKESRLPYLGGEDRDRDVGDKPSCGLTLSGIQLQAF